MKNLDIYKFQKFIGAWQNSKYKHLDGDQCMRALGFNSAKFDPSLKLNDPDAQWYLSEEEFILFVLRFS